MSDINDIRPDKIVVGFIGLSEILILLLAGLKNVAIILKQKRVNNLIFLLIFQDLMKQSDFIVKLYMMNRIYVKLIIRPLRKLKKKLMILIS